MSGRAFFSAISGLRNQQIKLDVIANNIANLNTFGYKSSRVTFADLLSQTLRAASAPTPGRGGTNPLQVGLGIKLSSIDTNTNQGSIQTTGNLTDLSINGEGYFILADGPNRLYTRAGNFSLDADGTVIDSNGYRVQGFTSRAADGLSISDSLSPTEIRINFGEKLEARATTLVNYRSNLDSSSFTYGSAELQTAGSTGLTTAAGIMNAIATHTGSVVDDDFIDDLTLVDYTDTTVTPGDDLVINGQPIEVTFPPGWTWGDPVANAGYVAEQINAQSTTVYARVTDSGSLIIDSLYGGAFDVIIGSTNPPYLNIIGLTAGTYTAPEPSSALAGSHTVTITDSTASFATTTTPVVAGSLPIGSIIVNGVTINYNLTAVTNTSAQNAAHVAAAINAAAGVNVAATANANGTLTLRQSIPGENNIIDIEETDAAMTVTLSLLGFDTIGTYVANPVPPPLGNYIVNNGSNAVISNVFIPEDGTAGFTREVEHDPPSGLASNLVDLALLVIGDNPTFPLIPGVILTAEALQPGQATIITHDAYSHQASIDTFDSLGTAHNILMTFIHVGENEWDWSSEIPDEPNLVLTNNTGTLHFGTSGLINTPNPNLPITFSPVGATTLQISPKFNGEGELIKGVTQFASPSTTAAENQDGWQMGILQAFAFDSSGELNGIFSNGLTRPIARLALGVFPNSAGLTRMGDNTFATSANSGLVSTLSPGTGGAGVILPGALEQSNVDAATEFTELIIAQRSYQANSRVITIQSELLQDVINLIR